MDLIILSGALIATLMPPAEAIAVMDEAMRAVSLGRASAPPRLIAPLTDRRGVLGLMPCAADQPTGFGAKVVSLLPGNPGLGRPAIQGVFVLFDGETGHLLAMLDGAELTALRTAAASGLATLRLSRPNARSHGLFGAGRQAVAHIDAIRAARPDIEEVRVWSRDAKKTQAFACEQAARTGLRVQACRDPQDAADCDVVTAVTASPDPILLGAWIRPGAHINLVGAHSPKAREADTTLMRAARIFVDARPSALAEAGDLLLPIAEGALTTEDICGELGELGAAADTGRRTDGEITVFKSVGVPAQDLWAARYVYDRACATGAGLPATL